MNNLEERKIGQQFPSNNNFQPPLSYEHVFPTSTTK